MNKDIYIKLATDFSETPGGRFISEGDYSGELFRETILLPKYYEAIENSKNLIVDLDGCYGVATSFLEESFGGLVRKVKNRNILKILEIISKDRPNLEEKIKTYIKEANINGEKK